MDSVAIRFNTVSISDPSNTLASLIDGTFNELVYEGYSSASTTGVAMLQSNKSKNQTAIATMERLTTGVAYDQQKYVIYLDFFIDPVTLPDQYLDTLSDIPPSYFLNFNNLEFLCQVDMYNSANVNTKRTSIITRNQGNNGWLNEILNGQVTPYEITNTVITLGGDVVTDVPLTEEEITFAIKVENTGTSTYNFASGSTKFQLTFGYIPESSGEYNNVDLLADSFLFDFTALRDSSQAAVNGENYGTDYQVLKDYSVSHVSATEVTINFKIALDSYGYAKLLPRNRRAFIVGITTTPTATYQPSSIAYMDTFDLDTRDFDLIKSDRELIVTPAHLGTLGRAGSPNVNYPIGKWGEQLPALVRSGDVCTYYGLYYLDLVGRELGKVNLKTITFRVYAEKNTGESFILFEKLVNLNATPNSFFSSTENEAGIRNSMSNYIYTRRTDLDDANRMFFQIEIPFIVRTDVLSPISANDEFIEQGDPFNGLVDNWYKYQNSDWSVKMSVFFGTSYDGVDAIIERPSTLTIEDFEENNEWSSEVIRTKDNSGNVLSSGSTLLILNDAFTTVEVDYTYTGGGTAPNINDIIFVGYIQPFNGRWFSYRWICSDISTFAGYNLPNNWLKGINTPYLADITKDGNVYTVKFKTDPNNIFTADGGYRISGRIYNRAKFIAQYSDDEMIDFSDGTFMNFN
jgi:hypothetical protein